MKGIEIISLVATIVIIIGAIPKNQLLFRIINGMGSTLLVIYGSFLVAETGYTGYSTIALNGVCLCLSVYHTIRIIREKKKEKKTNNLDETKK